MMTLSELKQLLNEAPMEPTAAVAAGDEVAAVVVEDDDRDYPEDEDESIEACLSNALSLLTDVTALMEDFLDDSVVIMPLRLKTKVQDLALECHAFLHICDDWPKGE